LTDILWIQQLLMQSHNLEPFSESQLIDLFREVKEIPAQLLVPPVRLFSAMTLKRFDVFESEKSQSFEFGTAADLDLPSDR
jgi:hypothetical protein